MFGTNYVVLVTILFLNNKQYVYGPFESKIDAEDECVSKMPLGWKCVILPLQSM